MIVSLDTEKRIWQNPISITNFKKKAPLKLEIEGNFHILTNSIYENPRANIILND